MDYKVVYKKSVQRDLKKISKSEAINIIDRLEKSLSKRPESYPVLKGQFTGLRKFRVSNYRIIYAVIEKDVLILRIGHRRHVYDK